MSLCTPEIFDRVFIVQQPVGRLLQPIVMPGVNCASGACTITLAVTSLLSIEQIERELAGSDTSTVDDTQ